MTVGPFRPTLLVVRFDGTERAQADCVAALTPVIGELRAVGTVQQAKVQIVFPGDTDPQFRSTMVVDFIGDEPRVRDVLRALPHVISVYCPGERSAQATRDRD